jgi:hypothetical protein
MHFTHGKPTGMPQGGAIMRTELALKGREPHGYGGHRQSFKGAASELSGGGHALGAQAHGPPRFDHRRLFAVTASLLLILLGIYGIYSKVSAWDSSLPFPQRLLSAAEVRALKYCPLGLRAGRLSALDRLKVIQDPSRRVQVDVAAEATPPDPLPVVYGVQGKPPPPPRPIIPRNLLQVGVFDRVPIGMGEAIGSIRAGYSDYNHFYFSQSRSQQWILNRYGSRSPADDLFFLMSAEDARRDAMTWAFLLKEGGIALQPQLVFPVESSPTYPSAAEKVAELEMVLDKLRNVTEGRHVFVASITSRGRLRMEFIAATKENPIVAAIMAKAFETASGTLPVPGDEIVGEGLLNQMLLSRVQGVFADTFPNGTVRGVRLRPGVFRAIKEEEGMVVLLAHQTRKGCRGSAIVADRSVVKAWDLPAGADRTPRTLFFTEYPSYRADDVWNRIVEDDTVDLAKMGVQYRKSDDCPEYFSKYTINQKLFLKPRNKRILLDMAPLHRATPLSLTQPERQRPQLIPRIVMQTNRADQIPNDMRKNFQSLIDMNPEYDHHYFSDRRIRDFIQQHFDNKTLAAFDAVLPGAYKSDLFRYCFLYIKGGIYLDADFIVTQPFFTWISPSAEFISAEDCGTNAIHNGFLAAAPGNPVLRRAIDMAVDRISKRQYGTGFLWITGPELLRDAWREIFPQNDPAPNKTYSHLGIEYQMLTFDCHSLCDNEIRSSQGVPVLRSPYPTYKAEMKWYGKKNFHYAVLWKQRTVYIDGNELDGTAEPSILLKEYI